MSVMSDNRALVERAQRLIPGGVNSTNRTLPWPIAFTHAQGAYLTDADGNRYLDYHAAFGPIVLGHNDPQINGAVHDVLTRLDIVGTGITDVEVELAELINKHVPSADRILLTNSGSEATYAALRLARGVTGKQKIIKFQGTYHGWHDAVLMNVISPPEKIGQYDLLSLGMDPDVVAKTIILPFNDTEAVVETMQKHHDEIAAVLVEIIPHNIGCVLPRVDFLQALRKHCSELNIVLIFDEVITGFRHALGGYQSIVGVTPDLSTFAKAMANGFPIAALAGQARFMDRFGPGGGINFSGTYNGHAVGVAAAIATIRRLEDGSVHRNAAELATAAGNGIVEIARELGIPMQLAGFGSVFVPYFMEPGPIETYTDLFRNNNARDAWFRKTMCEHGVFMIPTAMKRNHVSAAHTRADVDHTLDVARKVLKLMPAGM
jgi:glutamate-1-semialdehyde 2,1-aminomutase